MANYTRPAGTAGLWDGAGNQIANFSGCGDEHAGAERVVGGARLVGTPRVGLTTSPYGRDYRVDYVSACRGWRRARSRRRRGTGEE